MDFLNNEGILVMLQTGSKPQRTLHMCRIVNKLLEFFYHPIPEKNKAKDWALVQNAALIKVVKLS